MTLHIDTSQSQRTVVDFNHHAPELRERYHETYDRLRSACPVAYSEANGGYWLITSYELMAEAARDARTFSSDHDISGVRTGYQGVTIPPQPFEFGFTEQDPPRTTKVRRVLAPFFTPARSAEWKPMMVDVTTACIDRVIEAGRCDFVGDLGSPIPALLTMMLLDFPLEHWRRFADANHLLLAAVPGSPAHDKAQADMGWCIDRLQEAIEVRSDPDHPGKDPLTALCQAEIDGEPLTPQEKLGGGMLLMIGGVDTTTSVLGSTIRWLGANPDARRRLRENPELMTTACEEFLRVFAPVTGNARTCTRELEMNGQRLQAGDRVLLNWAACNMDPAVFDEPHEIRLDRAPNRHATFGLGIHRCLGSNFARLVFQTVLEQVLERMPDFSIDESGVEPYPSFGVNRGYVRLPMTFTPGERRGSSIAI